MPTRYSTPRALEQAVREAARKSPRNTNKAIESFYLDRFLCRIFSEQQPAFVLKGGQSQLARRVDARESRDIDLVGTTASIEEALNRLKKLASIDLDDYLEFTFFDAQPIPVSQEYRTGYQVEFIPILGRTKRLNPIHIDLVVDQTPPEDWTITTPVSRLTAPGLPTSNYAIQTIEERIADKACAIMQRYNGRPSSRVKDLVDLAVVMCTCAVDADILARKLRRESALRGMEPIEHFEVPNSWFGPYEKAYTKEARTCSDHRMPLSIEQASQKVDEWLAPALSGEARGKTWDPEEQEWL